MKLISRPATIVKLFKVKNRNYLKLLLEKINNLSLEDVNNYIMFYTELNNLTFFIVRK